MNIGESLERLRMRRADSNCLLVSFERCEGWIQKEIPFKALKTKNRKLQPTAAEIAPE
jgi:hypothetical protein